MPVFLKPREIAEMGYIKNSKRSDKTVNNYQFVLQEIKVGRLKARQYGTKSRTYYLVSMAEIKRYQNHMYN